MTPRIVLDANQFVSATILPKSKPAKILDLVTEGKLSLIMSASIIEEVRRVLMYPHIKKRHGHTKERVNSFIEDWARLSEFTYGTLTFNAVKDDPTDNKYLECAVEGEADFIISGDRHLNPSSTEFLKNRV